MLEDDLPSQRLDQLPGSQHDIDGEAVSTWSLEQSAVDEPLRHELRYEVEEEPQLAEQG